MDRREFFGLGAAAGLTLTLRARPHASAVLIFMPHASVETSAGRGFAIGLEEARRTWQLLGRELDVTDSLDDAVAVVTRTADTPRHPLVVDARPRFACDEVADAFRIGIEDGEDRLLWHPTLVRYGAAQLNQRFVDRFGVGMDENAWAAWFAVKVVSESILRARTEAPAAVAEWMLGDRARFDGHKGAALRFDAARRLIQPSCRVAHDGSIEYLPPANTCAA